MHIELRLWRFTEGVRGRIVATVVLGLAAVGFGVARLALLGWLIGAVFAGRTIGDLAWPIAIITLVMVLRGAFEYARIMMAHETASRVQIRLRRIIYDRIAALGPGAIGRERSGAITLALTDGVEQLETYFGQFLPQFLIALLTPLLIFVAIAWIDLPVAGVMLGFALVALFAPALWHRLDSANAKALQGAHAAFAAEFLDSLQGLATLKSFGQSEARAAKLEEEAQGLFRRTMRVLATNVLGRGITDSSIACGAAMALALGAWRVDTGAMSLSALLIILMLGVEIFRPMRELRTVLHQGMVGMAAAQGIYRILDAKPDVADAPTAPLACPLVPSIAMKDVRFRYPGSRRLVHDGLNFDIAPGERIGLVGGSGGGKSSIVRLLLRFYDPERGSVCLGGHDLRQLSFDQIRSMISVVSQDTFLFHGTVEDNIRMGCPGADHVDIEAAAKAANIHDFIIKLPQGYATVIGERGMKLSGGQRQRIAIARALLRDTPILILDEALSAVDAENESVIQQALDQLMQGRTTLILAHRLSSVIGCDRILVLDDGRIAEDGPHDILMMAGGLYASLMAEQARDAESYLRIDAAPSPLPRQAEATPLDGRPKILTEGIVKAEGLGWAALVGELMALVMPWKGRLAAVFAFGVLRVIAFIGVGLLSALVLAALKTGAPYIPWLWALAVVAPLSGILHWCESWIAHDMAFRLLAQMRIDLFRKLDALAPAYLVRRRSGDLMALATNDVDMVEYFFAHTVAPAFVAVLVPASVLAALAWFNPWLAVTLIPFLAMAGLSPFLMRSRVDRLGSKAREAAGELGAFAVDSVQGLGEIVAFQQERVRGDQLDQLSARHIKLRHPFFSELTMQQCLLEIFTGLGGLAMVVVEGVVAMRGTVDTALLPLFTLLAMAAFLPVSEIAQVGRQLADTLGATRRLIAVTAEPVPVMDGPGVGAVPAVSSLALEDVSFAYPGQHQAALSGVNIVIPAGGTVALVGPSGAGKTTTAQLLMRFWDPDKGRLVLNGHDLRDYRLDELREQIGLVAQDTHLFNDTLRHNILIARPDASNEELAAAIDNAALRQLVDNLPDGLETVIGERGAVLSGGQRQRVAIARAFLKNAPVLILDEATSHLDAVNEQAIRDALHRLQCNRTTVVIAHRLSTIRTADRIVVLDQGKVCEIGSHDELLSQKRLYAHLVSRQLASGYAAAAQ